MPGVEDPADGAVGQVIAVVVDVQAVYGVGVHGICVGIGVEDENGPARIAGCPEGVQVAQIEALVAEWWPKAEAGEVVGHVWPFLCLLAGIPPEHGTADPRLVRFTCARR